MTWLIKDQHYTHEPFAYAKNIFTDEELILVESLCKDQKSGKGELDKGIIDENYRESDITWIPVTDESTQIYEKISNIASALNDQFYKFHILDLEIMQYAEYKDENQGRYKAHSDDGYDVNLFRKLSISIQLSDPDEYQGGELHFYRNTIYEPVIAPKEKGTMIIFPSFVIHEVTPVTKGTRKSLVSWINGPRFK